MIKKAMDNFSVVLLGVIFDPKKREILIGRRENDPFVQDLTWVFPGGRLDHKEKDLDKVLKSTIKRQTGYDVKNLGTIFSKKWEKGPNMVLIYFLCEVFKGKGKANGTDLKEIKWVKPEELQKYFTTPFHPRLKEYIINLK